MTRVIGLTGGLGTGKSVVARMFADLGAKVLDADKIAHQLIRPGGACFRPVLRAFGRDILTAGKIDHAKLAAKVFRRPRPRRALEAIIHPRVRRVIRAEIRNSQTARRRKVIVLDVPLLFETRLDRDVDMTVVVKARRAAQIARATKRFGFTKAEAQRRIRAQMPLRQKIRLADIIIDNNGSLSQTKKQVRQIWQKLR